MAVRQWAGSTNSIRCSAGTLNGAQSGAVSFFALVKATADNDWEPFLSLEGDTATGTANRRAWWRADDNSLYWEDPGGAEQASGLTITTADGWCLIGWTKATGSATPRVHKLPLGGSWSHGDMTGAIGNAGNTVGNAKLGRSSGSSDSANMRCAVQGVWKSVVGNDAAVEALGLETSLANWVDAAPAALWPLNQAATSTAVEDITGNGADQSLLTGTTVVTGDDPPGFSFDLTGDVTGSLAVTEASDTLAGSGTHTPPSIAGSLAETEAPDVLAAAGSVTPPSFTGTLAETEQDDVLAAAGTVTAPVFTGTLAVTEADDTLAAAGTAAPPVFSGTLSVTEADDQLAAAGTVTNAGIAGNLAVTEQADTLAATGTVTAGAVDVTVTIGPTRLRVAATVADSRLRELASVGDSRLGWTVGDSRLGWTVDDSRVDREE